MEGIGVHSAHEALANHGNIQFLLRHWVNLPWNEQTILQSKESIQLQAFSHAADDHPVPEMQVLCYQYVSLGDPWSFNCPSQ
jgi:hypothetical protein